MSPDLMSIAFFFVTMTQPSFACLQLPRLLLEAGYELRTPEVETQGWTRHHRQPVALMSKPKRVHPRNFSLNALRVVKVEDKGLVAEVDFEAALHLGDTMKRLHCCLFFLPS